MDLFSNLLLVFAGSMLGACGSSLFYVVRYGDRLTRLEVQLTGINNCIEKLETLIEKLDIMIDDLR